MTTNFYKIQDFQEFMTYLPKYTLSQTILGIIANLEKNINSTIHEQFARNHFGESNNHDTNSYENYSKKKYGDKKHNGNSYPSQDHNNSKRSTHRIVSSESNIATSRQPISNDDWVTVRSFKTTKLDVKVGVEKDINDIRTFLNKISNKNYDKQKDAILEHISEFATKESDSDNTDTTKIATFIFDIASTNKFFSEIYADLYSELILKFSVFSTILNAFIVSYKFMVDTIEYIDPAIDYDGFCLYTKQNDRRKAIASFIVMLMNRNVISKECITDIIQHFINVFLQYIEEVGKENDIEEFAEVLFIFITLGNEKLNHLEIWNSDILPRITMISKLKPKSSQSLSNRAVFKFMDIMDKLK